MAPDLKQWLLELLAEHPQGLSEHQVLCRLQASWGELFPAALFRDTLALFRAHFLLFHLLYRLRDELCAAGRGLLQIDPLCLRLLPYGESRATLPDQVDPLRAYYLELSHLDGTSAAELERLLDAFWGRYHANSRRAEALAVLGLTDPVEAATNRRRYRQLAMQHHPDRGGDAARFRAVREALEILRRG